MSDSSSQAPAQPAESAIPHSGIKIRGGPHKVLGIQKSAQDAQAERERFAREQSGYAADTVVDNHAQEGEHAHPAVAHLRGGPNKIQGIKESVAKAEEEREKTAGGTGPSKEGEQAHPAIAKLRGGPNKIQGIKESVAKAEEERKKAASEEASDS